MNSNRGIWTGYLDKAIFVFIILFLLSLSNSIFINQIGYFGALLLIIVKWSISKKNPFSESGLEIAFAWFIVAEILSAAFSGDQAHAFNNLLKRILLLPIVYVMIAVVNKIKIGKLIFNLYIAGTIITVLIYLYFALQHYLDDLYGITQSGPSIFQYPITASEIISFTVIFLFAFLVNEKMNLKLKLLTGFGFILSLAALVSTYKRTGWLGAAFGILVILIIKKQYKILIIGAVLFIILLFIEQDISRINVYALSGTGIQKQTEIQTKGKAFDIYYDDAVIVSDYQNGILRLEDSMLTKLIETPAPAVSFFYWEDDIYLALLADTRFISYKKVKGEFHRFNEFISPGFTVDKTIVNNNLFVLDSDSGLTVYQNPDQVQAERYSKLSGFTSLFVDSVYLCVASANSGFRIFKHYNGELINTPLIQNLDKLNFFFYSEGTIYFEAHNGLQIYHLDSSGLQKTGEMKSLNKIVNAFSTEESIGFITSGGKISILNKNKYSPQVVYEYNLGFTPNSVSFYNNTLYTTYVKPSRLLSIFDPYNQTNLTRLALWNAGIKIWKDNPLFGVGDIDLAEHYKKYKNPYDKEIQGHMHNNFIHVLVTLGLFGLLSVLFIFYRIISIDLKIISQTKNIKFVSSYALGAFGTFCGFLFSGLTELNFWDHEITTLIWFVFGLNVALFNSVRTEINN